MGTEVAQLLLAHAYQVRDIKDFYFPSWINFLLSCVMNLVHNGVNIHQEDSRMAMAD